MRLFTLILTLFLLSAPAMAEQGSQTFLNETEAFRFNCGSGDGDIKDASINKDGKMIITYSCVDFLGEERDGIMEGRIDNNNVFKGTYAIGSDEGVLEGEIEFIFNADGSAKGTYGCGTVVEIERALDI